MSDHFITHAFTAGEFSPTLFGRTDLEKYDLGVAQGKNFFVDYRGGLSTRPGTEFVDYIQHDDLPSRFFPFRFSTDTEDTYLVVFYSGGIRFIQEGAYVLESDVTITDITQAHPGVVTANSHGFSTGDWVKISGVVGMTQVNGQTFRVGSTTTNTFQLRDPIDGTFFGTANYDAYVSGGVVARIYTISHPYSDADIRTLRAYQVRDTLRLTHRSYATRNLTRSAHTSWTLTTETIEPSIDFPTGISVTPSTSGGARALFAVTAVDVDGAESHASDIFLATSMVDYTATAGSAKIEWTPVAGAVRYNVYRSRITSAQINKGEQIGFLGTAIGAAMVDNNIIPDFTVTPPQFKNPFAAGSITSIEITAVGTSYSVDDTIDVSGGGGSGFRGTLIVDPASGEIIGVDIIDGGSGYSSPTVSITTSTGSGATFTATANSNTPYPRTSTIFQQRQIYAGSVSFPLALHGSRPGYFSNFDVSRVLTDGDAFAFEIDSPVVTPILHTISNRLGLLVMTGAGIWLLSGGEEKTVTPLNGTAEPQTSTGCTELPPIIMDTDLLYLEANSRSTRLLGYDELQKAFKGKDVSILASHLFDPDNPIVRWAYAQSPDSLVWARRQDGTMICLSLDLEQNVFGWTPHETKGLFNDVEVIEENNRDVVYLVVRRRINSRWVKTIERMPSRRFRRVEDAWCVDCGLKTTPNTPAGGLSASAMTGTGVTFTSASGVFTSGMVGWVIRMGGGRATITSFTDANNVVADIDQDILDVIPSTTTPLAVQTGSWSLDEPFSTVSGLWHLEGQTVKVLLDGQPLEDKVVTDGAITLGTTGTKAIIGLGFTAVGRTLPPTTTAEVIEGKKKDIMGLSVRIHDTKGLKVGASLDNLYELKGAPADATAVVRGMEHAMISAEWDDDGQTYFVQDNPLPATILGIVQDLEVGDDTA